MRTPRLRAGALDQVVDILTPTLAQDSTGGTDVMEQTRVAATVCASVESLSGRELWSAQQLVTQVTHRVRIRWLPQPGNPGAAAVSALQNVRSRTDGRVFQVQYVDRKQGRPHFLDLLCVERNDGVLP
jgi:SPP1 family predicted phage head-tail adaptor